MHVWPSTQGDHRGAWRGHGVGATHGRVRWRWTSAHQLYTVLVGQDRIFVQEQGAICVLDPAGEQMSRITPDLDLQEFCLLGDAIVVRGEQTVAAYDTAGSQLWRLDLPEIHAMHVGPTQTLYVWTADAGSGPRLVHSKMYCIDAEGGLCWSEPYPVKVPGLLLETEMVCDDAGILYTVISSRVGDGVSGDDVGHNGIAAFSRHGCEWVRPLPELQWFSDTFALASGMAISDFGDCCCLVGDDGTVSWTEERAAHGELVVEVPGTDLRMLVWPRVAQWPDVGMQRTPQHSTLIVKRSFDLAGNSYLACQYYDSPSWLISLDPEYRPRWWFKLEDGSAMGPVIGPDDTVLFPQRNTLLAIE